MTASLRIDLRLAATPEEAAGDLISLGVALGRLEGLSSFTLVPDTSLGVSRRDVIGIVVNFTTSLVASAAYDALKSLVLSNDQPPAVKRLPPGKPPAGKPAAGKSPTGKPSAGKPAAPAPAAPSPPSPPRAPRRPRRRSGTE